MAKSQQSLKAPKQLSSLCNPQKQRELSKTIGSKRRRTYLYLGEKIYDPTIKTEPLYERALLLKKPGSKPFSIAKIQYKAGKPLWYCGTWDQTDILGIATDKTIWQIKRAILTAYRRQYQQVVENYQAKIETLRGIYLNGDY